jgi:hypothetical protein
MATIFDGFMTGYGQGRKFGAQRDVGGAMARGDYEGAARAAYGFGELSVGQELMKEKRRQDELARRAALGQQAAGGDLTGATNAALEAGDFEAAAEIAKWAKDKSAQEKEAAAQRADQVAALAYAVRNTPPEQRAAAVQQLLPQLQALGFQPQQLDAFDWSDQSLDAVIAQSLGVKEVLMQQDREADNARDERRLSLEGERVNIARGQLGVSQGNLALSRQRERRVAAGGGSSGGGGGWEEF